MLVTLKTGVLDPAGQAVANGLQKLGFEQVNGVRIGKALDIEIASDASDEVLQAELKKMSEALLANPVIEDFEIELSS